MRFFSVANVASLLGLASFSYAQFPPTPEGVTVLDSKFGDGVKQRCDQSVHCTDNPISAVHW